MSTLFGRDEEMHVLIDLLGEINQRGGVLVVRGQAGIGKSTLLSALGAYARRNSFRVFEATGVESETHLPFAGLHQLLRPVLAEVDRLPKVQSDALRAAFGLDDSSTPNLFLVGLAVLNFCSDLAAVAPTLILVDDAQWLDTASNEALTFVARRLESDPIVFVVAVREGFDCPLLDAGLPELDLRPISVNAAESIVDATAPGLSPDIRRRILEAAGGFPIALVELPLALASSMLVERDSLPDILPVSARIERMFAKYLSGLPKETVDALVTASANDSDSVSEILQATSSAARPAKLEHLLPAVSIGLVQIVDDRLQFRHPLARSAIYQSVDLQRRKAAHRALAATLNGDPDRTVWHLAASVTAPDERVAEELERAAARAIARGATSVGLAALERAAEMSGEQKGMGHRLLNACELAFELGRHHDCIRLLRRAEPLVLSPLDGSRMAWLREVFDQASWSGASRVRAFVPVADELREVGQHERALVALNSVALRCYWSNTDGDTRRLLIDAAERIDVPEHDPRLINTLALVGTEERSLILLDRLERLRIHPPSDPGDQYLLGEAASALGALEVAAVFMESAVAGLRAQGRLGLLAGALVTQSWSALNFGNWTLAERAADEGSRLALETGQPLWALTANLAVAKIAAYRGDEELAEQIAASAEAVFVPIGANPMLALVQMVRGATAITKGRYEVAYEALRTIYDTDAIAYNPHLRPYCLVDLAESSLHCGMQQDVRKFLEQLELVLERTRSPLLGVSMGVARPLLASDDQVEVAFKKGFADATVKWPFYHARLQLAFGEWLRRRRRMADARGPLRAARDAFDALGARSWSERARQELRATGESSRNRGPRAWDTLTPQELQIAQMAADGMTNKEIGQQLYLSHRTVGSHLYRIFPKLGITARSQLRDAVHAMSGGSN